MKTFTDKRIAARLFILWTFGGATAGSITAGWMFLICSNFGPLARLPKNKTRKL
jgi:hypothetical protein